MNVYTMDDDLAAIIKKEKIQAVLVSPLRIEDFRENQAIQDILIGAGVKIIFAQGSKEAVLKNGVLSDKCFERHLDVLWVFVLAAMEIMNKNLVEIVSLRPGCAKHTTCAIPRMTTPSGC